MTTCARCVLGKNAGAIRFFRKTGCVTVDGSEIRRSPVEVGSFFLHYLQGFCRSQVVIAGFLNHQQCDLSSGLLGCQMVELGDPPRWIR